MNVNINTAAAIIKEDRLITLRKLSKILNISLAALLYITLSNQKDKDKAKRPLLSGARKKKRRRKHQEKTVQSGKAAEAPISTSGFLPIVHHLEDLKNRFLKERDCDFVVST